MIDAHKQAIDALEKSGTKAEDLGVAPSARNPLHAMQEHLRIVKAYRRMIDEPSRAPGNALSN